MADTNRVFAVMIRGYKKPGMDEEEYHNYMGKTHAPLLKDLLIRNNIVGYTMVSFVTFLRCEIV